MITLAASDAIQGVASNALAVTYTIFGMEYALGSPSWKRLTQGQLGTSALVLYAAPAHTASFLSAITLSNTSASAVTVQLFSRGSAAINQLYYLTLMPYSTAFIDEGGIQTYNAAGRVLVSGAQMFDAAAPSPVTPLIPGTAGTSVLDIRRDHTHNACGGMSSSVAPAVGNMFAWGLIPPNLLQNGTVIRVTMTAQLVNTNTTAQTPYLYVFLGPCGPVSGGVVFKVGDSGYSPSQDLQLMIANNTNFAGSSTHSCTVKVLLIGRGTTVVYGLVACDTDTGFLVGGVRGGIGSGGFWGTTFDPTIANYVTVCMEGNNFICSVPTQQVLVELVKP